MEFPFQNEISHVTFIYIREYEAVGKSYHQLLEN